MSSAEKDITPRRQDAKTPRKTKIKICGLKDVETALTAVEAGADYLGLNFVKKSVRYVTPDAAHKIVDALPAHVEAVGLFCDHDAATIRAAAQRVGFKTVQLHGHEGPNLLTQLDGLKVIKAVGFKAEHLGEHLAPWRDAPANLSALLIDTPPDSGADTTGGSGVWFDWEALAKLEHEELFHDLPPRFLAGGLTPDNVAHAVRTVRPYAVDVASGVESSRGVKDPAMIGAFCDAVRAADAAL